MYRRYGLAGFHLFVWIAVATVLIVIATVSIRSPTNAQNSLDWGGDWEVQSGFDVGIDAVGFDLPSAISFVPNPGTGPKDPLYFVTELRGRVKVVTNDRSVFNFAEIVYDLQPKSELPEISGEVGMAGLCLDANHGYVFATFAYRDQENILRNNVVRFKTEAGTFSLSPTAQVEFTDVFLPYRSVESHQIGSCQVSDGLLYVSVADGRQVQASQQLDSLLGKVLRMTLDGKPVSTNPFHQDGDIAKAANFVWAMGLRNPFGLKIVGDRLFVADNGNSIDRFLEIKKGTNYLWDGSDSSLGMNAEAVLVPGRGVGQLEYYAGGSGPFPPRFADSFFVAVTGNNQSRDGVPNITALPYDLLLSEVRATPSPLLRYNGDGVQILAGLGMGPDGLYFAPMLPIGDGSTAILKIKFDPGADYPYLIDETRTNPLELMRIHSCFACHSLDGNGGGSTGPVLDRAILVPKVIGRLNSDEHTQNVKELDRLDQEPFVSSREARRLVEEAQGLEQVRVWLENRIIEPRFDDANAQMPNLGVPERAAKIIATYLIRDEDVDTEGGFFGQTIGSVRDLFPTPTRANATKYGLALASLAFVAGGIFTLIGYSLLVRFREREGAGQE